MPPPTPSISTTVINAYVAQTEQRSLAKFVFQFFTAWELGMQGRIETVSCAYTEIMEEAQSNNYAHGQPESGLSYVENQFLLSKIFLLNFFFCCRESNLTGNLPE